VLTGVPTARGTRAASAAAALAATAVYTDVYVSSVSQIVEWPQPLLDDLGGHPAASLSDAAPRRRSCSRIGGRSAVFARAWNRSLTMAGCSAAPSSRVKTVPASVQAESQRVRYSGAICWSMGVASGAC
jgi:hypothetical protein